MSVTEKKLTAGNDSCWEVGYPSPEVARLHRKPQFARNTQRSRQSPTFRCSSRPRLRRWRGACPSAAVAARRGPAPLTTCAIEPHTRPVDWRSAASSLGEWLVARMCRVSGTKVSSCCAVDDQPPSIQPPNTFISKHVRGCASESTGIPRYCHRAAQSYRLQSICAGLSREPVASLRTGAYSRITVVCRPVRDRADCSRIRQPVAFHSPSGESCGVKPLPVQRRAPLRQPAGADAAVLADDGEQTWTLASDESI